MKKNILRIHLNGTEPKNYELNVAELTEIVSKAGFRQMTDATPANLPVGSVVAIYNTRNQTFFFGVVREYYLDGSFGYIPFSQLKDAEPEMGDMEKYDFKDHMYNVYMQVAVIDNHPQAEVLEKEVQKAGFRPLAEATPEDLPDGCVTMLYSCISNTIGVVIVRTLSMSNKRFLFWNQSAIVAGDWHSNVIMDELNPFENYQYLVIS